MLFITYLANWQVVFLGVLLLGILFIIARQRYNFFALIISVAGGEIFVWLIKNLIHRPRPPLLNALAPAGGFSFPSGHAFVAFSFYGLLAYFLYRVIKNKWLKGLIVLLVATIVLAIGFSRIYLGVHWPSDVLAGYASGIAWLVVLITGLETRRKFGFSPMEIPIKKSAISILGFFLFLFWFSYTFYFFQAYPLKTPALAVENPIIISHQDIPQRLFLTLPRASEDITGMPMEPINIIVVGTEAELDQAFMAAGWTLTDPFNVKNLWRLATASLFNRPYPSAPGTPTFWHSQPNDFAYEKQVSEASVRERQHIHFWPTPFFLNNQQKVWLATAHLDKEIKLKLKFIIPIHTIDPAIDLERKKVNEDLLKTGKVESVQEFSIVSPMLGKNQAGDQFFTDGKADILFLKNN